ncbi:MAG TPA: hypothetical protein VEC57_12830 [Candidatus Limnocylindrales bacterium]|nr:hypothetical protein [Candidatus Limnocylindrales bacterium]
MQEYVSPFDDRSTEPVEHAPRLSSLAGKRVTMLSIRKPKSAEFLDELGRLLTDHGAIVTQMEKPTFTRPAPADVLERVRAGSDAVVEALAD